MASELSFVEYVAGQAGGAGAISYKKMFGDYGIYCDGKIVGLICDNVLYVKITEDGAAVCPNLEEAPPYDGAKPHFVVEEVDNSAKLAKFIRATCDALPAPKPKKKK